MLRKFYIHAPNVHNGGGRSLLGALLQAIRGEFILSLDDRMPLSSALGKSVHVKSVTPNVVKRILAEIWLAKSVSKNDIVLCFGNLPPLFRLRGRTVVFLQNRYLIEDVALNGFSLKTRLRISLERFWLSKRLMNVDEFVVQTQTMEKYLVEKIRGKVPVSILPFVAESIGYERNFLHSDNKDTVFDFVYVASGEPHKNHERLIQAWCVLANEGLYPSLCLTLDETRFAGLCGLIKDMQQRYSVRITNLGGLSHDDILSLYGKSGALIYPSKFESCGLPLIEARQAGLPVLAAELDYVRDVLDPEQVFDPDSPMSIARAVKRFMGLNEKPLPLLNASQFLALIFQKEF